MIRSALSRVIGLLALLITSSNAAAYCPTASDVSVVPATPDQGQPFQIELTSRVERWINGTVMATVQGQQIFIVGRNATSFPVPVDVAAIAMAGLPAGGYQMVIDITSATNQVVQCPTLTLPLTIAGAPPQEARAAPALSPPMLAALLILLLGGGLVAVRRLG